MTEPEDDRGLMPREKWEQTPVHKTSRYYCGKCGQEFVSPHDLYDHLDREHADDRDQ